MLILLIVLIVGRKKEEELEQTEQQRQQQLQDVETKKRGKRSWISWVVALLGALAGCILFILTEDWTLPMIWIDQWTIWQLIIFAVILVFFVVGLIKSKDTEEVEAYEGAQAQ